MAESDSGSRVRQNNSIAVVIPPFIGSESGSGMAKNLKMRQRNHNTSTGNGVFVNHDGKLEVLRLHYVPNLIPDPESTKG